MPASTRNRITRALIAAAIVATQFSLVTPRPAQAEDACTISWDGGAGSASWSALANWSLDRMPTATDLACIGVAYAPDGVVFDAGLPQTIGGLSSAVPLTVAAGVTGGLTITGGGTAPTLVLESGTLVADGTFTADHVDQRGAALRGAGTVTVSSSYLWRTGSIGLGGGLDVGGAPGVGEGGFAIVGDQLHFLDAGVAHSRVGFQFDPHTTVVLADDANLMASAGTSSAGAGVVIGGTGVFQNEGEFELVDGDDLTIRAGLVGDQGWFGVAGSARLTLEGLNEYGGDFTLADEDSRLVINDSTTFTQNSSLTGPGRIEIGGGAVLTSEGEIDVAEISGDEAGLVAGAVVHTDFLSLIDGGLDVRPSGSLRTDRLGAQDTRISGAVHVLDEAVLTDVRIQDDAETSGPTQLFVDGRALIGGYLWIDDADVQTGDLFVDVGTVEEGDISLLGTQATLDVLGTFSMSNTTRISQADGTEGTLGIHDLMLETGTLDVEPLLVLETDDFITVGESALLHLSDAVIDGTTEVFGTLDLRGEVSIGADIDMAPGSHLFIDANARVQVLGGTVGGDGASIVNTGVIAAAGTLVGAVENEHDFGVAGTLDISGTFTQLPAGRLFVGSDEEGLALMVVTGNVSLAGAIELEMPATPPTSNVTILAAASITGWFDAIEGLGECNDLWVTSGDVVLTVDPCVTISDGSASEDEEAIVLEVTLDQPQDEAVELLPTIEPGEAGMEDYYTDVSGSTIVIAPGETTATLEIPIVDDEIEEGAETFTVELEGVGSDSIKSRRVATATIIDNDTELEYGFEVFGPADGSGIDALGPDFAVGATEIGDGHWQGWQHPFLDGSYENYGEMFPADVNSRGLVVGTCKGKPCVLDEGETIMLATIPDLNVRVTPLAVNENDEIVGETSGATDEVVRWASPSSPIEILPGLDFAGATRSAARDVTTSGMIVGYTSSQDEARGWLRRPDGSMIELPAIEGHPYMTPEAANDAGVVVGSAHNGNANGVLGFIWSEEDGMQTFGDPSHVGPGASMRDVNPSGDVVGVIGYQAVLVREGEVIDLRDAVTPIFAGSITLANHINPDGVISVRASTVAGQDFIGVLVPPGAGCRVCLDASLVEPDFPNPKSMIDVGDELVEGNPAEFQVSARNRDQDTHELTFTVIGPDGNLIHEPITETVAGQSEGVIHVIEWDSNGAAWLDPTDPGEVELTVEVVDESGYLVASKVFHTLVVPRPVVTVHGMNSDASTWAAYDEFVGDAHPRWRNFSIDTMDTSSFFPNTIAENAALLASYLDNVQNETNAWQVDVVAHSMGGLISRYYIDRLMTFGDAAAPRIRQLIMLGTPNEGSPCASLLPVPMTTELRPDVVAAFNGTITNRRGVQFSLAAGDPLPFTCQLPDDGDEVVPVESALWTIEDTEVYDIFHTDMTGSAGLFHDFVLPRLVADVDATSSKTMAPSAPSILAPTVAPTVAGGVESASPQLLGRDPVKLAPGASYATQFSDVPAGLGALGVTILDAPSAEIRLERNGVAVATTGTDASAGTLFRTVRTGSPAGGKWTIRVINHGAEAIDTTMSTWVADAPTRLVASMRQVGITGDVEVTAHIEGDTSITLPQEFVLTAVDGGGNVVTAGLADNGNGPDRVAGDGLYTGLLEQLPAGPVVAEVWAGTPFSRMTTAALVVEAGVDGPGNDAPLALDGAVTVRRDVTGVIELQAGDPEGTPLTYEIVDLPEHGTLGGLAPRLNYLPEHGFSGTDRLTFRVSDGALSSELATVVITVGRSESNTIITSPGDHVVPVGSTIVARVGVWSLFGVPATGGTVEFELAGRVVEVEAVGGVAETTFLADMAKGKHALHARFSGDKDLEPSASTITIEVIEGVAPEAYMEPIIGEAGYASRYRVTFVDPDHDVVKVELDYTDDGTFDASVAPQYPTAATFDHVVPVAGVTTVRARVFDSAGHATDVTTSVTMAPHRPLGALTRVQVGDEGAQQYGISEDGRYVLVEDSDNEGGTPRPDALTVVDRTTGVAEPASVLNDGTTVWITAGAALSPNGRMVAFGRYESVDGFSAVQTYVRDLDRDITWLLSTNAAGERAEFFGTRPLAVTNDGRVLFESKSTNLTDIDIRQCSKLDENDERNRCNGLYLASPGQAPVLLSEPIDGVVRDVQFATMSSDGRFVAFTSTPDYEHWGQATIRVVDLVEGTSEVIDLPGIDDTVPRLIELSWISWIADDGQSYVVDLGLDVLPGDNNRFDDLVHVDRVTGKVTLLTADASGRPVGGVHGSTDRDGRRTAFWSIADELDAPVGDLDLNVFVVDRVTGITCQADVEARDGLSPNGPAGAFPHLSADGRYVAFDSVASNLVPGDFEEQYDTFVLDLIDLECGDGTPPPPPPINHAPTVTVSATSTGSEGSLVPVTVDAKDVDGDPLTITWSASDGTLITDPTGLTGSLVLPDGPSTVTLTVTADDGRGAANSVTVATASVEVLNVAPTVTITTPSKDVSIEVGKVLDLAAITADHGSDVVTCSIKWADAGTAESGCSGRHAWSKAGTYTITVTAVDEDGAAAEPAKRQVTVVAPLPPQPVPTCTFGGFAAPVDGPPAVNVVKAGSTVPVKFRYCPDGRLDILVTGSPWSTVHPCSATAPEDPVPAGTPGASTLTFDSGTGRYHYNWQTDRSWAGQCRTLVLRFTDGTEARAEFRFK